jgi:ribosomal-protein-alanine N-acetyltransferase
VTGRSAGERPGGAGPRAGPAIRPLGTANRPMTAADLEAVARLEQAAFGAEAWSAAMLAGELAGQPATRYYLVAEQEGVIVGYGGLLIPGGGQADLVTLAVAPGHWGQGIGGGLLTSLLAEAARRGCAEVCLEVRVDNGRAQRLYRRYGFTPVGVRRGYYQPSGADALVMRKLLGAGPASRGDPAGGSTQGTRGEGAGPEGARGKGTAPEGARGGGAR